MLSGNINTGTIKKNMEYLLDPCEEVGLEAKTEKPN
jgi:hypothetical protein